MAFGMPMGGKMKASPRKGKGKAMPQADKTAKSPKKGPLGLPAGEDDGAVRATAAGQMAGKPPTSAQPMGGMPKIMPSAANKPAMAAMPSKKTMASMKSSLGGMGSF